MYTKMHDRINYFIHTEHTVDYLSYLSNVATMTYGLNVITALLVALLLPQRSEITAGVIEPLMQHEPSSVYGSMETENMDNVSGFFSIKLTKRATMVGQAVFQGLKAAKYLLRGSKPVAKGNKLLDEGINEFQKSGGYQRAYLDFHTIQPSNIKELGPPEWSRLTGKVGDRVIILNKKGYFDAPMIEVIKDHATLKPHIDVIHYDF